MAVYAAKGTILQQDLASTYTTVAQVLSIGVDGSEAETFDTSTLDQAAAFKTYAPTGYTEPGSASGEMFYDPALAGHKAVMALLATPADEGWKIIWSDSGTTEQGFTGAGLSIGATAAMGDGIKASFSIKIDGDPGYADS